MAPSSRTHRSAAAWRLSICERPRSDPGTAVCNVTVTGPAHVSDIDTSDAEDFGTRTDLCNLLGSALRLGHISSDYTGIGSQLDHRPGLGAADGAGASRYEDDAVRLSAALLVWQLAAVDCAWRHHIPNMPSFQTELT